MKKSILLRNVALFVMMLVGATAIAQVQPYMGVAGTFNGWNTEDTSMTYENEVWKVTIALPAGETKFKFINTPTWDGIVWGGAGMIGTADPNGGDISFTLSSAGSYVFTFNDVTLAYSISLEGTTPEPPATTLTVGGDLTADGWANDNPELMMTLNEATGVHKLSILLPAGNYNYKVFRTGTWNGAGAGDNRIFTIGSSTTVNFYAKGDNEYVLFACDQQDLYLAKADGTSPIAMTNVNGVYSATKSFNANEEYTIISFDSKGEPVFDILTETKAISTAGTYKIEFDLPAFTVTAALDGTSSVEDHDISTTMITVSGNSIEISTAEQSTIYLYNITGQLIAWEVAEVAAFSGLSKGMYIVKVNDMTTKVMVK